MNDYRYDQLNRQSSAAYGWGGELTVADASLAARMGFIRKVYALFLVGIFCAIAGVGVSLATGIYMAIVRYYWLALLLLIGSVFAVNAVRRVKGVNLAALFAFTFFEGLLVSPLVLFALGKNPLSLVAAGGLTVATFGGLTAYTFVTRKDFSFLSGFLFTGLIVILVASLIGIFVGSSVLSLAISSAAVLLFAGYVLYDTSNIMRDLPTDEYVAGALSLFLDFFGLFIHLLNILNILGSDE
ncbi:MAG: Bax inhibitor-1/YccA family protein [Chloracidobacterium sp.]|nr:Bax inhibitor-1/YccA family protein [Chloracidobacterium sp.]MDW8217525.1 Bax inhibitor-1/YccA family protein [Acidobacteriota bacterium]